MSSMPEQAESQHPPVPSPQLVRLEDRQIHVTVTDINMPFPSMVWFMIKWALAVIPATIILGFLFLVMTAVFGGIFGGLSR